MITSGIREAKAKLSSLVKLAKSGQEIVITEHGKPIVRLSAIDTRTRNTREEWFTVLQERGLIHPEAALTDAPAFRPLTTLGKINAQEMLREDREDRA